MPEPNILCIMSDEHHAGVLGCHGCDIVKTPNLDRLSAEGVTFDDADWGYARDYVEAEQKVGRDRASGRVIIEIDPKYDRPAEVDLLLGSPHKARRQIGWEPRTTFDELVELMMKADMEQLGVGDG